MAVWRLSRKERRGEELCGCARGRELRGERDF